MEFREGYQYFCLPGTIQDARIPSSSIHENVERPILEGQKSDCTKRQLAQGRRSKPSRNDFGISLAASPSLPSRSRVHDWPDGEGLAARLTVQVCCLSLLELSELEDLMKDCVLRGRKYSLLLSYPGKVQHCKLCQEREHFRMRACIIM